MRACEFMTEGRRSKIDHSFQHANPGAVMPGNRDRFYDGRTYDGYRMSLLTGMHPDDLDEADVHSWQSNMPMYTAYTKAEHDKITRAMKKMGHTVEHTAYQGSQEPPDTHKVSPVNTFAGYGR
jgi:hypothetical protein